MWTEQCSSYSKGCCLTFHHYYLKFLFCTLSRAHYLAYFSCTNFCIKACTKFPGGCWFFQCFANAKDTAELSETLLQIQSLLSDLQRPLMAWGALWFCFKAHLDLAGKFYPFTKHQHWNHFLHTEWISLKPQQVLNLFCDILVITDVYRYLNIISDWMTRTNFLLHC